MSASEVAGGEEPSLPELEEPEFTTLDRMLIRAVVSSLNRMRGSLDATELDDLVDEIVELNDSRVHSYFHRGFLDSLLDRPPHRTRPGDNAARRAWYLQGWLLGSLRRHGPERTTRSFLSLDETDRRRLTDSPQAAPLLEHLLPVLLQEGRFEHALHWIERMDRLPRPYQQVALRIVEGWSRVALLEGDPEDVALVLERTLARTRDLAPFEQPADPVRPIERRLAIARRMTGRLTQARDRIERLLETCEDPEERRDLLGDLALVRLGVRSLESLALPKKERRDNFLATVEAEREVLEQAAEADAPAALVALALPVVARESAPVAELQRAIERLRRAVTAMDPTHEEVWRKTGLLDRARFYLAVLELRTLEDRHGPGAVSTLERILEGGFDPPSDLLADAVRSAVMMDVQGSTALAVRLYHRLGAAALRTSMRPDEDSLLPVEDLCRSSPGFRALIAAELEEESATLSAAERRELNEAYLRACRAAAPRDVEGMCRALDCLERLAERDDACADRFLDLLHDRDQWDPAWDRDEVEAARVRILLRLGRRDDARAVLQGLAQRAVNDEARDAAELLDRLEELGEDRDFVESLRRQLRVEAEPEPQSEPTAPSMVRVLFIGGNETQAAYREVLERRIRRRDPHVRLDFEFAGWGSNWGRTMKRLAVRFETADAVVIMRFVRTQMGRAAREKANAVGIPWVTCSGHGCDSIERALLEAVRLARRRGGRAPSASRTS